MPLLSEKDLLAPYSTRSGTVFGVQQQKIYEFVRPQLAQYPRPDKMRLFELHAGTGLKFRRKTYTVHGGNLQPYNSGCGTRNYTGRVTTASGEHVACEMEVNMKTCFAELTNCVDNIMSRSEEITREQARARAFVQTYIDEGLNADLLMYALYARSGKEANGNLYTLADLNGLDSEDRKNYLRALNMTCPGLFADLFMAGCFEYELTALPDGSIDSAGILDLLKSMYEGNSSAAIRRFGKPMLKWVMSQSVYDAIVNALANCGTLTNCNPDVWINGMTLEKLLGIDVDVVMEHDHLEASIFGNSGVNKRSFLFLTVKGNNVLYGNVFSKTNNSLFEVFPGDRSTILEDHLVWRTYKNNPLLLSYYTVEYDYLIGAATSNWNVV